MCLYETHEFSCPLGFPYKQILLLGACVHERERERL
jgi:hypothetical protein